MAENIYMTIPEMREYLCISKKTAYSIIASGKIPVFRISMRKTLVKRTDVNNYVNKHKT